MFCLEATCRNPKCRGNGRQKLIEIDTTDIMVENDGISVLKIKYCPKCKAEFSLREIYKFFEIVDLSPTGNFYKEED